MTSNLIARIEAAQAGEARLGVAISTAMFAHSGQRDKGGNPYILHPLRVMSQMTGEDHKVVAVLHDVVEDSGLTIDQIAEDFGNTVADAVDALTRRAGESYARFIERCSGNDIARVVKLADLSDNMDISRLGREPNTADIARLEKYALAAASLKAKGASDD